MEIKDAWTIKSLIEVPTAKPVSIIPDRPQTATGLLAVASSIIPVTISPRTRVNSLERNAAAPKQLSPFLRTGSRQQPSSTTSRWNMLTDEPLSNAVTSDRLWRVLRLRTISSLVLSRTCIISCHDSAKWHLQPTFARGDRQNENE